MAGRSGLRTLLSYSKRWLSRLNPPSKASSTRRSVQTGKPHPQQQSFFLSRLSIEIRVVIYQHIFGPSLVYIVDLGYRPAHVRCLQWQTGEVWDGHRRAIDGFEGMTILDESIDPITGALYNLQADVRHLNSHIHASQYSIAAQRIKSTAYRLVTAVISKPSQSCIQRQYSQSIDPHSSRQFKILVASSPSI